MLIKKKGPNLAMIPKLLVWSRAQAHLVETESPLGQWLWLIPHTDPWNLTWRNMALCERMEGGLALAWIRPKDIWFATRTRVRACLLTWCIQTKCIHSLRDHPEQSQTLTQSPAPIDWGMFTINVFWAKETMNGWYIFLKKSSQWERDDHPSLVMRI